MSCFTKELLNSVLTEDIILKPSVQGYFADIDAQYKLLRDKARLVAFKKAIYETVKPGDVVMDIGAGTGILSRYALEAGASLVYLVEENSHLLSIAEDKLSYQFPNVEVRYIPSRSTALRDTDIPKKVDVIISETVGSLGINEGILYTLRDARRFLTNSGRIIPICLELYCSTCSVAEEFSPLDAFLLNDQTKIVELLTPWKPAFTFEFMNSILLEDRSEIALSCSVTKSQYICVWFKLQLSPSITLSNKNGSADNSWGFFLISPVETEYKMPLRICYSNIYSHLFTLNIDYNDSLNICLRQLIHPR